MRFLGGIWKRKVNGEILDYYPCPFMIGDVFITTNKIPPEIRYPGTEWEKLPEETYLMIASSKYQVKSTGGENEHTLTVDEMPNHKHDMHEVNPTTANGSWRPNYDNGGTYQVKLAGANQVAQGYQGLLGQMTAGGNKPHNNMPKFYAIYGYRRIA